MTNLEKIQTFDAVSMAVMITELLCERDRMWQRKLSEHEIEVDIVHIGFEKQVQRHREWLESEVDADEDRQGDQEAESGI